jgi:deoxyribonuclease (pyrimidine dimer)
MTRINLVPPHELTDQHLIAEYREIFMVAGSLRRTLISKNGYNESKVPKKYTLNKGHVYFFYNKGKYLHKRYLDLISEMKSRGFSPSKDRKFPQEIFIANDLYNNWVPDNNDLLLIRERINQKIQIKPSWYRKTKYITST